MGQLLKLPALFQHYYSHHDDPTDDDHDISFMGFLEKHYTENGGDQGTSKKEHENLPFKSLDCHAMSLVVMEAPCALFATQLFYAFSDTSKNSMLRQHYSSTHLNNIWQPPRLV